MAGNHENVYLLIIIFLSSKRIKFLWLLSFKIKGNNNSNNYCQGYHWSGKPWKSQGINSVVSENLEKSGNFSNLSLESGSNCMESCLGGYHSHSDHVVIR